MYSWLRSAPGPVWAGAENLRPTGIRFPHWPGVVRTVCFYFFDRYREIHKLCAVTVDADNLPSAVSSRNSVSHNSFSRHSVLKTDFDEYAEFPCTGCGLSAPYILQLYVLMCLLQWNSASSVKTNCYNTQSSPHVLVSVFIDV